MHIVLTKAFQLSVLHTRVRSKTTERRKRYSDSVKPKSQHSNNVNPKLSIRLIRYVLKSEACGRRLNAANGRLRLQRGGLGSCKLLWYVFLFHATSTLFVL